MKLWAALLSLAASGALAVNSIKETVIPPREWIRNGRPPSSHVVQLRIGLRQANFDALERHLYEVSDPSHRRYGDYLSKGAVEDLVAPHPESLAAVDAWLSCHGLPESDYVRSPAKDWLTIKIPVSLAEELLDTKYHVWRHTHSGEYIVRTTSYSLPSHLHDHIDVIQPTTIFSRTIGFRSTIHNISVSLSTANADGTIRNLDSGAIIDNSCKYAITLNCLKQLYNATTYTATNQSENGIGITGYLEQYANIQDLQSFYGEQQPVALGSQFEFVSINAHTQDAYEGGQNPQNISQAGAEANLDVQFAFGLSFPIQSTFYSTAGRPPFIPPYQSGNASAPANTNEPYGEWLDHMLSHNDLPATISTSYGDNEDTGARGISLLFSSGDSGVGNGECLTNDGTQVKRFVPSFPASCPYVTAVGGTSGIPEQAVFFSGGGFSNYFPRPKWQDKSVKKYLASLPNGTYEGLYNGIPDVSAYAESYRVWYRGIPTSIGGTSASAPAFAGIVALLNDALLKASNRTLGFLNPLLYEKGLAGLNDIKSGNNPGCGTDGFNATEGWDPATGLGTPNFGKLKDLLIDC
ncbi:tripeptidyl peptidase A [Guyanagaster necrorhizus]|uniref:tripeptidyl-peptidase II n=1 Tax=Guyanagaster necrorhizus TaxID=856835 RepID=A0A9P7VV95_9AGAR|nr:tripeptidyl peptidase A [Guyanagaster necrorhizus MCA 3950]KAG7447497.1 tripeptidyl peptidase A [Guyanagaster necrorhizus MCA 3950]